MTPVESILDKLAGVRRAGKGWSARCPAHDDRRASLSISEGDGGVALLKCHAGCDTSAILAFVGLKLPDLFPPKASATPTGNGKHASSGRTFATANAAVAELERRQGKRSALWTYHNAQGEPVGVVVRWDKPGGKDIRPVARHGDGWRIGAMPVPRPLHGLVEMKNARRVIICEGEKAMDAARAIGFTATTSAGGSQAANKTDWHPLAGREVWIFPDNDPPGRRYAETVVMILMKVTPAPEVRVIELPNLPDGGDLVDWIEAHGEAAEPASMLAEIETLVQAIEPLRPGERTDRDAAPEIVVGTDEYRVNDEAAAALGRDSQLFQRGGILVHVVDVRTDDNSAPAVRRPDATPVIRDVPNSLLREYLTRVANWMNWQGSAGKEKLVSTHPPAWCVSAVADRRVWPSVRRLEAVVTHPVLLPNGEILAANGFDRQSNLLVRLPHDLAISVPDRPSRDDVAAAVANLSDLVADFHFETLAHRAAWFAGLLTPLAWFAFSGPSPLFLIDANVRAAGKGLLADMIGLIVTGRRFPVMAYTSDRAELRKRITTLAAEGDRLVLLDNLAGAIGNDILDAALTADHWKDRLLGGNKVYDGPLHVCWYATGNNVQLHADTARRACHCRIETADERPELREGFRYPDLRGHVRANRGQLLSSALLILRSWHVSGRPTHSLPAWGSFEGWSSVVREAVVSAGLPDPGSTRLALQSTADSDAVAMAALIDALERMDADRRGVTTGEIVDTIRNPTNPAPEWLADLRSAIEELCGRVDSRILGYRLRHFARRNFNGRMIDRATTVSASNSVRWVVRSVSPDNRPKT
jgi:hypothetical protein